MNLFPFFEDIEGKVFLMIGGGKVAERKVMQLRRFRAEILVVAPKTAMEGMRLSIGETDAGKIKDMVHHAGGICILERDFLQNDILAADYVIAASDDPALNASAAKACRDRGIPVNVVDAPELCTFIFPGLVKRGSLTVGITTGGSSPSASRLLRERIEEILPDGTEEILERMEKIRKNWKSCPSEQAKKNANRRALLRLLETGNQASDEEIEAIMHEEREQNWVIATRGSALALAQAEIVRELLKEKRIHAEIHVVSTKGDRDRVHPLKEIGGKGLFVKEVEREILSGAADIAVHSGKDLPYELADGTVIAGVPDAADGRDCLITRKGAVLSENARIGTGSPRRIVQMKKILPDAKAAPVRGNVDTRLQKLREGEYDGILLAKAGLDRLHADLSDYDVRIFCEEEFLPAACQGMLAVQCRKEDTKKRKVLEEISDPDALRRFRAERYMIRLMEADCSDPIGAYADIKDGKITIRALYGTREAERFGDYEEYQKLCGEIADEICGGERR